MQMASYIRVSTLEEALAAFRAADGPVLYFAGGTDILVKAREAECPEIPDCNLCIEVETADGPVRLIDYSSAGKTYDDSSRFAAWLPIKS